MLMNVEVLSRLGVLRAIIACILRVFVRKDQRWDSSFEHWRVPGTGEPKLRLHVQSLRLPKRWRELCFLSFRMKAQDENFSGSVAIPRVCITWPSRRRAADRPPFGTVILRFGIPRFAEARRTVERGSRAGVLQQIILLFGRLLSMLSLALHCWDLPNGSVRISSRWKMTSSIRAEDISHI